MDIVTLALAKKYADEKLTNGKVDLTGYAKEDYVDAEIEELNKKIVQETGKLSEEKVDQKELENYALKDEIPTVPVQSVNGKTGAVQLSASEVGALPNSTKIPANTSDLTNDSGFITNLVNNLANYYLKSETYTQEEINQKLSIIPKFSIKVVSSLPTSDINDTTVYLVKSGEDENNLYTEYIYVDGAWELLGKQSVDLSDYALTSDIPTALSELTNDAGFITKYVSDLENYYVKNDVYNKDEIDAKGYLTEHQDISGLAPKATTLAGYGIIDGVTNEQIEQFSGTVEITSDAPTKEQTVLTINPESETVNLYTAEEVDEKFNQLSEEKVDKSNVTLDKHTDGLIYIFVDGKPVGNGVEVTGEVVEGDVIGTLDENNNIILSGDIPEGTYTLKYLNEDGTYTDIGTLEVSGILKVTSIGATKTKTSYFEGDTLNTDDITVTATYSDGSTAIVTDYTVDSSTVQMDTAGSYNLVISYGGVSTTIGFTVSVYQIINLAKPNPTNTTDISIWCNNARLGSDGTYRSHSGTVITNFIPCTGGVVYVKGMNISLDSNSMNNSISFWDDSKNLLSISAIIDYTNMDYMDASQSDNGVYTFDLANIHTSDMLKNKEIAYVRLVGSLTGTLDDVVITVNQPIE